MKNHFDNLLQSVSGLSSREILDLGSGKGGFVIEATKRNCKARGLELNPEKVAKAIERSKELGLETHFEQGVAEDLPYPDGSFDFINVSEVIEHVNNPSQVLSEMYRVMRAGGLAYISAHNRFGFYDTHYHLYLLGWIPRSLADNYINLFKKDKDYNSMPDTQRINEMHYYTFRQFKKLSEKHDFRVEDIREKKIKARFKSLAFPVMVLYKMFLRPFYFSTFHILLKK